MATMSYRSASNVSSRNTSSSSSMPSKDRYELSFVTVSIVTVGCRDGFCNLFINIKLLLCPMKTVPCGLRRLDAATRSWLQELNIDI